MIYSPLSVLFCYYCGGDDILSSPLSRGKMSKSRVTAHSRKRHNLVFDFIQEFINQPDKYKDLNSYDNLCGVAIKMSDYFYEYFETRDFEDNGLHKHLEQYKVLYLDEDKISYQDVSMSF